MAVNFICGGNRRTGRKQPNCHKSPTNFITLSCIGYTSSERYSNVYDITVLDISSRNHGLKPLEISRDIHGLSVVDNQRLIKRHENFNSYLKFKVLFLIELEMLYI